MVTTSEQFYLLLSNKVSEEDGVDSIQQENVYWGMLLDRGISLTPGSRVYICIVS